MRYLIVSLVLAVCSPVFAQVAEDYDSVQTATYEAKLRIPNCHCKGDTLLTLGTECDTVTFSNGAKFIRFFNCDSLWTVFVSPQGKRRLLMSYESMLFGYDFRLGYQVEREFNHTVLFTYGCPANGPCNYVLLNKSTGSTVRKIQGMLYAGDDPKSDYLVWLDYPDVKRVVILNVERSEEAYIPILSLSTDRVRPEWAFNEPDIDLKTNTLTLEYKDGQNQVITIDKRLNKLTWHKVKR